LNENRNVSARVAARPVLLATFSALIVLAAMIAGTRYARAEDIRFAFEMAGWAMMAAVPRFTE